MNISRRNLLMLGGGAVTAPLLARPDVLHAGSDGFAVKVEPQRGKVRIRDVQSASIADEYVCNLIKITTDSGLFGRGEARCKIPVAKQVKAFKELVIGEDPLRVDYLTRKMMTAIMRPSLQDIGVVAGIETALWDLAGKILRACLKNSFKQMFVCAFVPRSGRKSAWRVIQAA